MFLRLRSRLRQRRLALGLAVLAVMAGSSVVIRPAVAETLAAALERAYRVNPKLEAERARLRATDEEIARANSGYRPTIGAAADVGRSRNETTPSSGGDGATTARGYSVTATQPIFDGFRTRAQVGEAEATVRAGRETLRSVEADILLSAVTAYCDVLRDQSIVRLRENNVAVLARDLRASRDRFTAGELRRTDVAQSEARHAGAVSALDLARANLRSSRARYEQVVGSPPGALAQPAIPRKLVPPSLDEALAIAARESPSVVSAQYREQAARHTVDRVQGELLPSVSVRADYSHRFDDDRAVDERERTSVQGRVTVPIYEGGEVRARVRQSKHTHVSRLQEIQQAHGDTQAAVVAAWSRMQAAASQLESDLAQVEANRTALTGVREEQRVGQRTILDVLNAEQELLASEVTLASTRRDLVVVTYQVLALIGRLNVSELGIGSLAYDPARHTDEVRRKWFGLSITHGDGRRESLDAKVTR
jgi:outer membrane protein